MKNILNGKDKSSLIGRIKAISGDERAVWGKMNVEEMVCHITDQLRMAIKEIKTDYIGNKLMETVLRKLVLMGMPFPKGKIETVKELKQGVGGTAPTILKNDIETLINYINKFDNRFKQNESTRHPAFGYMNIKEWGRLAYIHIDYHLRQFGC